MTKKVTLVTQRAKLTNFYPTQAFILGQHRKTTTRTGSPDDLPPVDNLQTEKKIGASVLCVIIKNKDINKRTNRDDTNSYKGKGNLPMSTYCVINNLQKTSANEATGTEITANGKSNTKRAHLSSVLHPAALSSL